MHVFTVQTRAGSHDCQPSQKEEEDTAIQSKQTCHIRQQAKHVETEHNPLNRKQCQHASSFMLPLPACSEAQRASSKQALACVKTTSTLLRVNTNCPTPVASITVN